MTTESIISIAIAFCALIITALTFRRNSHHETSATATERATMTADIQYIRQSIDDIKVDNRVLQKDVSDLKAKVVEIEASTKSAHKRIDDFVKKG